MNTFLLIAGFFLLVAVGLWIGRKWSYHRSPSTFTGSEAQCFIRTILKLVEHEYEQAARELAESVKFNTHLPDVYFALGTLFRQCGEHERAVRVHKALLTRRDIDDPKRIHVHYQLAKDFLAAGVEKRAMQALEYVISKDKKHLQAIKLLASLYEKNKEWERAAFAYRRIQKLTGTHTQHLQAHLYAEMASQAMENEDMGLARKALKSAISVGPEVVHVLHVLAVYHKKQGNLVASVGAWKKCLRLSPELAACFFPQLEAVLFEQGKLETVDQLWNEFSHTHKNSVPLRLAYATFDAKRNAERALGMLQAMIDDFPTLMPAWQSAAKLILATHDSTRIRDAFEALVSARSQVDFRFRCSACQYASKEIFWRCPKCQAWESVQTIWGRRAGETRY